MKQYLGDSVYAETSENGIVLTTDNGMGPSNTIVLEPEVLYALQVFLEKATIERSSDESSKPAV